MPFRLAINKLSRIFTPFIGPGHSAGTGYGAGSKCTGILATVFVFQYPLTVIEIIMKISLITT